MLRRTLLILATGLTGGPAIAADFSDPTWPCVQRKVEHLSLGLMWPVTEDAAADDAADADVEELAEKLSLRRIDLEDMREEVSAFAASHDGDPDVLSAVFEDVFNSLDTRRTRIIAGIADFSLSQIALAKKIDTANSEMTSEMALDAPDYDKVDRLEEQLDWDQLIYSDRQQSIRYLCETPVLIERRLFEISQMLQAEVKNDG